MKYRRMKTPAGTLFLSKERRDALLNAGIRDFYKYLGKYTARVHERNDTTFMVLKDAVPGGPGQVVAKLYPHETGIERQVKDMFRWGVGIREFKANFACLEAGIDVPEPIAAFETKRTGTTIESYYLSEDIQDAENVRDIVLNPAGELANAAGKHSFIRQLGRFVADAHYKGMYHGDLNASNILAARRGDGTWRFLIIDFVNVRVVKNLSMSQRIKELARLEKSVGIFFKHMADSIRFYKAYTAGSRELYEDRKEIYEKIRKRILATEESKLKEMRREKRTDAVISRYSKKKDRGK